MLIHNQHCDRTLQLKCKYRNTGVGTANKVLICDVKVLIQLKLDTVAITKLIRINSAMLININIRQHVILTISESL